MIDKHFINKKTFSYFMFWYLKIIRIFLSKKPLNLISIVSLNVASQLLLLGATSLPLKVILMMSSESIPKYFPSFLMHLDLKQLIYLMTLASIIFWISFSLIGLLTSKLSRLTFCDLIVNTNLVRSEKQKEKALNFFEGYIKSISEMIFSTLAMIVIASLYPAIAIFCVVYLVFINILIIVIYSIRHSKVIMIINKNLSSIMISVRNVGFVLIFLYIVFDFFNNSIPSFLFALISLILSRQLLMSYTKALTRIMSLYIYKNRNLFNKIYVVENI